MARSFLTVLGLPCSKSNSGCTPSIAKNLACSQSPFGQIAATSFSHPLSGQITSVFRVNPPSVTRIPNLILSIGKNPLLLPTLERNAANTTEHLWKNRGTAHAGFRMSADCDRLSLPGARGARESLLISGGEERETQRTQPKTCAVCLAVVPDGFVSASFIAVLFTPGRPKVNCATESHVLLSANT